jgi:hypothetical protein
MRLCDWCDQPTPSDADELCEKCARAKQVQETDTGRVVGPIRQPVKRSTVKPVSISLTTVGKYGMATILGFGAIVAALFGTCSLIGGLGGVFYSNLSMGLQSLLVAGLTFALAYFLAKAMNDMFKTPPKAIQRRPASLSKIDTKPPTAPDENSPM